jgi:hypothetical protein
MDLATAIPDLSVAVDPLAGLLDRFESATPELLRRRALLSRIDSKFVLPAGRLDGVLGDLDDEYAVLRVDTGGLATYRSLYFDTPALQCFHDHRRGRRIRHKIRIRHYPDRQVSFLEVKTKRHETMTAKQRMQVAYGRERLGPVELEFLHGQVGGLAAELRPQVAIVYRRISLISLATAERVTIDVDLSAGGDAGSVVARALGHLAVIEVKQWPFCVRTPIMRAVRGAGYRVTSMSKYVTALALMHPDLPCTRLLPALRDLQRI